MRRLIRGAGRIAPLLLALLALPVAGCSTVRAPPPTPTATPSASAEEGRALFRNKGCIGCHANARVPGPPGMGVGVGPDLTDYSNDPELLRRWLADPPTVRPGTEMPSVGLSAAEIEHLIAFLNAPR